MFYGWEGSHRVRKAEPPDPARNPRFDSANPYPAPGASDPLRYKKRKAHCSLIILNITVFGYNVYESSIGYSGESKYGQKEIL